MPDINMGDLEQLYYKTIVMLKDSPVYITSFDPERNMYYVDLKTGKKHHCKFVADDVKPVVGRVGYINHNGHSIYMQRMPVRRYQIGLNTGNCKFLYHEDQRHHQTFMRAYDQVSRLNVGSIANAILNNYPSFREAVGVAKVSGGACAFDKQFSIDSERNVYYKTKKVGVLPARSLSVKRIEFKEGFEFLETILEPHYEKTVRTFEAA